MQNSRPFLLLLTDENYKNGFYVNSVALVTDKLILNATHDPNLSLSHGWALRARGGPWATPPAPPHRAPACPGPSRRPQNPGAHLEEGSALQGPHDLSFQTSDLQGLESLSFPSPT